jgi:hypothetical protein
MAKANADHNGTEVQHYEQHDYSCLADVSGLVSRLPGCSIVNLRIHRLVRVPQVGQLSLENCFPHGPLALAALVGITWYASRARTRARADRRWRAALDRYAQQEQAKGTHSWRNSHARPQSQAR